MPNPRVMRCSSGGHAEVRCGRGRAAVRAYQYLRDSTNLLLPITLFCTRMLAVLTQCWLYVVVRTIVRH